ncbi:hypothetical protein DSO57_1016572 [Entomophthora muscae]|uniref:Uncharacterized protein n=1 Tax=Entomophthora muscae TaxID=34485 RepID=A0ACC2RVX7_9FUNG|nr:hypothetical protein DSO57_1016572 [Entomophthora muscae]
MDFETNFFEKAKQQHTLQGDRGQCARLQMVVYPKKGFLLEKGVWINYRRNYFEIDCLVSLTFSSGYNSSKLYLDDQYEVLGFRVAISANYCDGRDVGLVQFTTQRQKDKKSSPPPVTLSLSKMPSKSCF